MRAFVARRRRRADLALSGRYAGLSEQEQPYSSSLGRRGENGKKRTTMATKGQTDKYIFWVCLALAAALFIGSFFCPPMGEIHPSVLKAGGILVAMQALGIAGQNLYNGKDVTFNHGDTEVKIGNDEEDGE